MIRPIEHPQFTTLAAHLALAFPHIQPTDYRVVESDDPSDPGCLYACDRQNWYSLCPAGRLINKPIVRPNHTPINGALPYGAPATLFDHAKAVLDAA